MYKFVCKHCKKDIAVEKPGQVGGHITHCNSNPDKGNSYKKIREIGPKLAIQNSDTLKGLYLSNPKKCMNCGFIISYENKEKKFCNHSCSASFNNKLRPKKLIPIKKIKKGKVDWCCPVCYKELLITYSNSLKRKFCSGTCRNKVNNQLINGGRSKAEKLLEITLLKEFPNCEILFNNRCILSGNKELDVYIPSLKLAIEWNGIYHYKNFRGEEFLKKTQTQDLKKQQECKKLDIELYVVKDLKSNDKFIKEEVDKIVNYINNKIKK